VRFETRDGRGVTATAREDEISSRVARREDSVSSPSTVSTRARAHLARIAFAAFSRSLGRGGLAGIGEFSHDSGNAHGSGSLGIVAARETRGRASTSDTRPVSCFNVRLNETRKNAE
jgi:hypothetical protein